LAETVTNVSRQFDKFIDHAPTEHAHDEKGRVIR
jgi:hypothetical protein